MSWLGYLVFGLVAGALARLLHPGKDPMNWIWTMLLGIGGAELGGFIGKQFGANTESGLMSWVAAIGGAILLLVIFHALTARSAAVSSGGGPATNDDYKQAVFNDLSKGPRD